MTIIQQFNKTLKIQYLATFNIYKKALRSYIMNAINWPINVR